MPAYDDIADAYVMIADGATHSVTIDTTNATSQNLGANNSTDENYWLWGVDPFMRSCWMVVDLSDAGIVANLTLHPRSLTSGYSPEGDILGPLNPWDAQNPDFNNLNWLTGGWGDGTQDPGEHSVLFTRSMITGDSDTGKFYIAWVDYDYGNNGGVIDITYSITLEGERITIPATQIAYTASPTVSVGGGSVGDTQYWSRDMTRANDLLRGMSDFNPTLRLDGTNLPSPGQYRFFMQTENPDDAAWFIMVKRNGLALQPFSYLYAATGQEIEITGYGWLNGEATANNSSAPTVVPIAPDDVIDICLVADDTGGSPNIRIPEIVLVKMADGGISSTPISILGQPIVLGASPPTDRMTGNITGQPVPQNPGWLTGDLCVTDNGNVYVIWDHGDWGRTIQLWEWDGDSWNQISNNVAQATGTETGTLEDTNWVSIDTDGTNVYMAYGFNNGTTANGRKNMAIYVSKYDPGSQTLTRIVPSTGILAYPHVNQFAWCGSETQSVTLKVSPAGVPWVVWPEVLDNVNCSYHGGTRPQAARYNGGTSWTVHTLPDPPNLEGTTPYYGGSNDPATAWGCSEIADCQQMDLVFSHGGTPTETPTVVYFANYWYANDASRPLGEIVVSWWNGSAWQDTTQTRVADVWGMGDPPVGSGTLGQGYWNWWSQGTRMVASQDTIYLVLAPGHTQYGDRGVAAKMLPDASGWVALDPEVDPEQTGQGLWSWLGDPYFFPSGRWGGGWDYPSVTCNVDPNGLLFISWDGSNAIWGTNIVIAKEMGTTDGYTVACKHAMPLDGDYGTETTHIVFDKDGNLYFLMFMYLWSAFGTSIVVIKYPREDYAPWIATHAAKNMIASADHAYGQTR